jgi:hypothetical protein
MFNHTTYAKAFVTATCALAIALSTIGMGVNSSHADPNFPCALNCDPRIPYQCRTEQFRPDTPVKYYGCGTKEYWEEKCGAGDEIVYCAR